MLPIAMWYALHEMQKRLLGPVADAAGAATAWLDAIPAPGAGFAKANLALLQRIIRPYARQPFGIDSVVVRGREVAVREEVVQTTPFCRLVRFARDGVTGPRVLVCAPLSGHHPTLVRDTIATLLQDFDVYVSDWTDAREVDARHGAFPLADYVKLIERFIRVLGARDLAVVSVCQPTVPVLAAVSRLAAAGEATPRALVLMGGPIDARVSPTVVNKLATDHPIAWFEKHMIHRVPESYPGRGRAVYPGFLQLSAFVMMNPGRHAEAYRAYWLEHLRGDGSGDAARAHEKFYDEYNAVLDMDAAYYLDTVRVVFQEFALARGTWEIDGALVDPGAITATAVMTIEGELDDISGRGQTEAALSLCSGATVKRHLTAEGCGHYGLFSGSRWREQIYPQLRAFLEEVA